MREVILLNFINTINIVMNSTTYTFETTRPEILIRILNPTNRGKYFDTRAIVDTGAENSLFGSEMPPKIGLDVIQDSKGKIRNEGIGGVDLSYLHEVIIQVMTPGFRKVFWQSKILKISSSDKHKRKRGLLGVKDILYHFEIHIDFKEKTIQLITKDD